MSKLYNGNPHCLNTRSLEERWDSSTKPTVLYRLSQWLSEQDDNLRYLPQRAKNIFCWDDRDILSLHTFLARIIYRMLERFRKVGPAGYPPTLTEQEWDMALYKMSRAFWMAGYIEDYDDRFDRKVIQEGLSLFSRHFLDLWD